MKLSTEAIKELLDTRAEIAKLEKKEKEYTESLKKQMKSKKLSEYGPKDSPWKLVYDKHNRASVPWKELYKKSVKQLGMKWKKELQKLQNKFKIPVTRLLIEPNEKYEK